MWRVLLCFIIVSFCFRGAAGSILLVTKNSSSTFQSLEAEFTPEVSGSGVSGYITLGNPDDACSTLESASASSSSPFLLTMRGNCSFDTKVRYAQDAGFAAVIVYNNESGSSLLTMAGSSDGISIYAVFVTRATGLKLLMYANDTTSEVWILPTYEDTVWSVMVFTLISLLAVAAAFVTWYTVRRHRNRQHRNGYVRYQEPCVMSSRIVQAMPSITYKSDANEKAAQESCTICLEEYLLGEKLRVLPCSHRFHCVCVDAWLTMWRAVCPICKRDARYEFPDMQVSERTPLLNTSDRSGGYHGASPPFEQSNPILIRYSDTDKYISPASTHASRPGSYVDPSLVAFRASPYFTPPSSSQRSSHLLPGSYSTPYVDCSPHCSYGSRDARCRSFLNLNKAGPSSPAVGSCSSLSYGSRSMFLNPTRNNSSTKLVIDG